jgi:hypothetical protein
MAVLLMSDFFRNTKQRSQLSKFFKNICENLGNWGLGSRGAEEKS